MPISPTIAVIGGINIDICGTADSKIIAGDSNPGRVRMTPGGVGRNIAENLARLGANVELITVLGDDEYTDYIRTSCREADIGLHYSISATGTASGVYLCINDVSGDLYTAVSDMRVCSLITPEFLSPRLSFLNQADLVVVDANLPEETLSWLSVNCMVPLFADPVSVKKAVRLRNSLPNLTLIKPNCAEAEILTGISLADRDNLPAVSAALRRLGIRNVFITLGPHGVYYDDGATCGIQPCLSSHIINTNGCGDAFLAAAALSWLKGMDISQIALLGQAASAVCSESEKSVSPLLNWDALMLRSGLNAH